MILNVFLLLFCHYERSWNPKIQNQTLMEWWTRRLKRVDFSCILNYGITFFYIVIAPFLDVLASLGSMLGISWAYHGHISGISQAYLGHNLGITRAYIVQIFGISWVHIGHILGLSCVKIEVIKSPSESEVSIFGIFVGSIFWYDNSNWQRFF